MNRYDKVNFSKINKITSIALASVPLLLIAIGATLLLPAPIHQAQAKAQYRMNQTNGSSNNNMTNTSNVSGSSSSTPTGRQLFQLLKAPKVLIIASSMSLQMSKLKQAKH